MDRSEFSLIMALAILLFQTGCATLTKSHTQSVTVTTDPPGALCVLQREGKTIAAVNPTPGTVSVEKDKDPIHVECAKHGYLDSVGELSSEFEAMTFGNIIFGGLIGVGVDAVSGAMHEYPPLVTITLIPGEFASVAERDTFFDQMVLALREESENVRQRILKSCQDDLCDRQLKKVEEAERIKLKEIEGKRDSARIVSEKGGEHEQAK